MFMNLIPDVIFHTREQDESQVREHYDRTIWSLLPCIYAEITTLKEAMTSTLGSLAPA